MDWSERESSWDSISGQVWSSVWESVAHEVRSQVILTESDRMWMDSVQVKDPYR